MKTNLIKMADSTGEMCLACLLESNEIELYVFVHLSKSFTISISSHTWLARVRTRRCCHDGLRRAEEGMRGGLSRRHAKPEAKAKAQLKATPLHVMSTVHELQSELQRDRADRS